MKVFVSLLLVCLCVSPSLGQCFGGRCAARRAARQMRRAETLQMHASRNMMTAASRGYSAQSYGCGGSSMQASYSTYQTYSVPATVTYGSSGTTYQTYGSSGSTMVPATVTYGSNGSAVAPVQAPAPAAVPEPPVE